MFFYLQNKDPLLRENANPFTFHHRSPSPSSKTKTHNQTRSPNHHSPPCDMKSIFFNDWEEHQSVCNQKKRRINLLTSLIQVLLNAEPPCSILISSYVTPMNLLCQREIMVQSQYIVIMVQLSRVFFFFFFFIFFINIFCSAFASSRIHVCDFSQSNVDKGIRKKYTTNAWEA